MLSLRVTIACLNTPSLYKVPSGKAKTKGCVALLASEISKLYVWPLLRFSTGASTPSIRTYCHGVAATFTVKLSALTICFETISACRLNSDSLAQVGTTCVCISQSRGTEENDSTN